jgi:hypothetical protein
MVEDKVGDFHNHAYLICYAIDNVDWDQISERVVGMLFDHAHSLSIKHPIAQLMRA